MKHLITIIALLWAAPAAGQSTGTLILAGNPLVDNQFLFGPGNHTTDQIVILADGENPADGVFGIGARSRLTPSAAANAAGWHVTTDSNTAIEPRVENVSFYGAHGVPDFPHGQPVVNTAGCIYLAGDSAIVRGNQIFDYEGWAIKNTAAADEDSPQRRVARINDNNISHCNGGIWAAAVDTCIANNTVANVAENGILADGGGMQLMGNHCFGTTNSIVIRNGGSTSVNDKASDANTYGFHVESTSTKATIIGLTSIHVGDINVLLQGSDGRLDDSFVEVANSATEDVGVDHDGDAGTAKRIVGLYVDAERWVISNCFIDMGKYTLNYAQTSPRASCGVWIGANNTTIRDMRIDGSAFTGEQGIFIAATALDTPKNLDIEVTTSGGSDNFDDANDAIVEFSSLAGALKTWTGIFYVTYGPGEIPYRKPAGTGAGLKLYQRLQTDSTWTDVSTTSALP